MGNSIQHKPWCREHQNHEDGTSWYCSRVLHQTEAAGGVLVEVTWDPERGTRLILFADLDRSLERGEARDIAIALLVGSDQLEKALTTEPTVFEEQRSPVSQGSAALLLRSLDGARRLVDRDNATQRCPAGDPEGPV